MISLQHLVQFAPSQVTLLSHSQTYPSSLVFLRHFPSPPPMLYHPSNHLSFNLLSLRHTHRPSPLPLHHHQQYRQQVTMTLRPLHFLFLLLPQLLLHHLLLRLTLPINSLNYFPLPLLNLYLFHSV